MKIIQLTYSSAFLLSFGCVGQSFAIDSEETMTVTAEQALKQQPGVSIITSDDIKKNPPVNDLSEIIRKMPGVNLTGNSATGSRGNNRQIDIRGMGPENTLIMIDGVPVASRNSVRYSWRGERDTRGDSNWVPPELVERIEVIRGPAAARYGSGASGGVVNIITKRPTKDWHGSLSLYTNQPEDNKEGDTRRGNFSLSGPLYGDALTMRIYGSINRTDADNWNINPEIGEGRGFKHAAGKEGVKNKDINSSLSWKITPNQILDFDFGYGKQGNIYTGDTQGSSPSDTTEKLSKLGAETNRMYRQNYGLTHNGIWDWGQSKTGIYFEKTNNTRMDEGMAGGGEGRITGDESFSTSRLKSIRVSEEINIPIDFLFSQNMAFGAEWNKDTLNDPATTSFTANDSNINETNGINRTSKNSATISSLFIEDNIDVTDGTSVIPGLRFDHHNEFGSNFSPSLNISQEITDTFKLKAGISRAFKSPNLYQSHEGYLMYTRGNGCPINIERGGKGCYLLGSKKLSPEISINKEIGIEFSKDKYHAGITYFRNDYKNKIVSGEHVVGKTSSGQNILQWENGGKSIVEGIESNINIPVMEDILYWDTNITYMINSKQKKTGNPLSIIPKYTVNSSLHWNISDVFSTDLNITVYGKQKPRSTPESIFEKNGLSNNKVNSYSIIGTNFNYDINKNIRLNAGISNIFDKKILRTADGANTYNESGRAYYAGVTTSF